MLNELLPTDLVNGDGTIKPEVQANILSGAQASDNMYSPLQQRDQAASMAINDFRTGRAPGSSYAALASTKLNQRDVADEYNQKLIKRRNTGIEALMEIPSSKRAKAYPKLLKMLRDQGADVGMPENYDEDTLNLMKGAGGKDDFREKLALQHKYRMEELAAKPEKDVYQESLARKSAGENVELATGLSEIKSTLPYIKGELERAKKLIDETSPSWFASLGSGLSKGITGEDTKAGAALSNLQSITDSISNLKLRSTLGAAFTEREGLALKAILMNPNDDRKTKKEKIDAWIRKAEADISSKEEQLKDFAKGTGYSIPYSQEGVSKKDSNKTTVNKAVSESVDIF